MSRTRLMRVCAGVALAIGVTSTADAGLQIDLRLTDGGGKVYSPFSDPAGHRIPIDVYAIVTGTGTGVEGFQSAQGAFLGTGGIKGQILPAGDVDQVTFETVLPALDPFTGQGATRGASKYIGVPDGIIDLGDEPMRGDALGDLVVFRAPSLQVTSGAVIPNGRVFKIGRIEFQLGDGPHSDGFEVNWAFRRTESGGPRAEAALYRVDGANGDGTGDISVGAPIIIAIAEPAIFAPVSMAALGLLVRRRK